MAKMSQTVKEIIQIVVFLVVVGVLVTFYAIYPLNKTADMMGRIGDEEINPDSLPANDPAAFVEAGFAEPDTFRVEADGQTNLAQIYLQPTLDSLEQIRGTAILVHGERDDRTAMIPMARMLVDSGFAVIVYDQRASGYSSGKYHGEGQYEAADLAETISYLDLRNRIHHPVTAVGFNLGADAALLAGIEEKRIDRIVAVSPYLSSTRMLNIQKEAFDAMWFPFYRTVTWWWYGIRSGYALTYTETENVQPVPATSLVLIGEECMADEEVVKLSEVSDQAKLTLENLPAENDQLYNRIVEFVTQP